MNKSDSHFAIEVENLGKDYKLYHKPSDMLFEFITRRPRHKVFQALKNVTFNVKRGEVVGVIGRNGAGKSTLLKILTGTLDNTHGRFKINGKVSAILELGTGFHPEYTGRENIYMGGMCLGMTKEEIDKKVEYIINFSELHEVIDRPFKTYSSGMKARLTFSVAISVDPDIFIVDEALAAGDALFVAKCFKKISEICKSGATVFFVTHSTDLVRRLCHRCLYFKNGEIHLDGEAANVSSIYDIDTLDITAESIKEEGIGSKGGSGPAQIKEIKILNAERKESNGFFQHEKVIFELHIECKENLENPALWLKVTRSDGVLATTWLSHEPEYHDIGMLKQGTTIIELTIHDLLLGDGHYDLSFALFSKRENKTDTAFYADPMSIWEKTHRIVVQRRGRPLSTIFDQPIMITRCSPVQIKQSVVSNHA